MTIKNTGAQADKLIAAKTSASNVVELHDTDIDDKGIMRMRMVKGGYIEAPPGGEVSLEPAGLHVMLIDLVEPQGCSVLKSSLVEQLVFGQD